MCERCKGCEAAWDGMGRHGCEGLEAALCVRGFVCEGREAEWDGMGRRMSMGRCMSVGGVRQLQWCGA